MKKPTYDAVQQQKFCEAIADHFKTDTVTQTQMTEFRKLHDLPFPYFLLNDKYKVGRGKYRVTGVVAQHTGPVFTAPAQTVSEAVSAELHTNVVPLVPRQKTAQTVSESFVPVLDRNYVPFGFYNDLREIIRSKIFYPVYITGLSGNGKTMMVEQACAALKREFIRVNITKLTDESDLIGSYELIDGNTVRREGPVVVAMRRGAILLLDETDYGSEHLLCLQPILEGKGYYDKKTGEFIHPTPGFNIMATANTKGKGSDDGRYIGANTLNDAFLERFAITVEQEYPSQTLEKKMLEKFFASEGMSDPEFINHLTNWAELVRKSYMEGAIDELITTRRLIHIARAYKIFRNRRKAIELCLNRFGDDIKNSMLDFYGIIDKKANDDQGAPVAQPDVNDPDPFADPDQVLLLANQSNSNPVTTTSGSVAINSTPVTTVPEQQDDSKINVPLSVSEFLDVCLDLAVELGSPVWVDNFTKYCFTAHINQAAVSVNNGCYRSAIDKKGYLKNLLVNFA